MAPTPIERGNVLLEKDTPLTSKDKEMFAYFGVDAKILPPLRVVNPQRIRIGDRTAVREWCHIAAFQDLRHMLTHVEEAYRSDFRPEQYLFDSRIDIGCENQIGRFFFMTCTN